MQQVNWGIIGSGNVTEFKSGPVFNKVNGLKVIAVMRRSAEKAKDYASRHRIPLWYAGIGSSTCLSEIMSRHAKVFVCIFISIDQSDRVVFSEQLNRLAIHLK